MSDPQTARPGTLASVPFAATIGLGAVLLFSVQLLIGKRLLPWFGGTSALWTTCLLFFQAALLAGYAWAHALCRVASVRRQRDLHLLLLALAVILLASRVERWPSPITPGDGWRPDAASAPLASALILLAGAVGLPFVVLAATSPLLSAWFVRLCPGRSPFWLYALSNLGSLGGLLGYPLLVEPAAGVQAQGRIWSAAFVAYAAGVAGCAMAAARSPAAAGSPAAPERPAPGLLLLWLALSSVPALLLVAVTSHLTQEVAAVPLLWALPLALYLLSFILCFGLVPLARRTFWAPALAVAAGLALLGLQRTLELGVRERIALWCAVLFVYSMAAHGELVRRRPAPQQLTAYYLAISTGGVTGGAFCALLAPRAFDGYWELHVGLFAGALAVVAAWACDPGSSLWAATDKVPAVRTAVAAVAALVALAAALALDVVAARRDVALARRGFYGVLRVVRERAGSPDEQLKLLHGRIAHGVQLADPARRGELTTYFGPGSGAGLALRRHPRRLAGHPLRVGVVGLGVGTLAAWSRPGDVFRFYELDPEVVRLSSGEAPQFTYLRDARGEVHVVVGDGRLSLEGEPGQQFDVFVLDAFSSDSIPTHLLTLEAFSLYERHLRPGGVIAVQITNRFVDLKPVLRGVAGERGLLAVHVPSHERGLLWSSEWMLLSRDRAALAEDEVISAASLPPLQGSGRLTWTDDWSDLFRVMKR